MLRVMFWKRAARGESIELTEDGHLAIGKHQIQRRNLLGLSLVGAMFAAIAMAIGLPATGLAVYLVTTLPLVLFG
jgi:hypothetical protein